jgi:hypothetical protein
VQMSTLTPVGAPMLSVVRPMIASLQSSLRIFQLSAMPLLLCHVFEVLGGLPSPYPYVAVPISMQPDRVHPRLVPLYWRQNNATKGLSPSIVVDAEDGCLKEVHLVDNQVKLRWIVGIGFGRLLPRARREGHMPRRSSFEALPMKRRCSYIAGTAQFAGSVGCVEEADPPAAEFAFFSVEARRHSGNHPWTIQRLLRWLGAVKHNPRVRPFGHCDRSFGFYCDLLTEVCTAHSGDEVSTPLLTPHTGGSMNYEKTPSTAYAGSFDCILHHMVHEWNDDVVG